ncbi:MAG: radical SAM protein [Chloroflexi bacterium]|nr:radical SAM protein [Chloroflexota bacterium]
MVNVGWAERKSSVLSSSSLACLASIPAINLTAGCAHDCVYCYARGYSGFPGEDKVVIYNNILDKLKNELLRRKNKPQAVYFSPSSDIFQPIPEVLELSHSLLEFLLSRDIGIAFLTKGRIPERTLRLLLNHANKVKAQVGIITYDDNIRRIFEPYAARIDIRLKQMATLAAGGVDVKARVVPILPGLTDSFDSIDRLGRAIFHTGVKKAAMSTLFLRPAIEASLRRRISDKSTLDNLLDFYRDAKRIAVHAEHSSVIPLSRPKREEIYSRFRQAARKYAMDLSICGCMNPDIGGTCNITGQWPTNGVQPSLFV